MSKQLTRWLDPILLIGLFISISIGVGMVLSGNDSLSGLTVGILSTIITLLIDVVARIQKAEDAFTTAAGLSKILSDKTLGQSLQDIANSHETIKKYSFPHYDKIAKDVIDECQSKLREIASGSVVVEARTPQAYGMLGFQQARKDIKVIVHSSDLDQHPSRPTRTCTAPQNLDSSAKQDRLLCKTKRSAKWQGTEEHSTPSSRRKWSWRSSAAARTWPRHAENTV